MCSPQRLTEMEKNGGSVSFNALVLDRTSYTRTVENVFDLSFLVKMGKATMSATNGVVMVKSRFQVLNLDEVKQAVELQSIVRLDFATFQVCLFFL
jgi:hypothetical protein